MKSWLIILLLAVLSGASAALAHASLVFGELSTPDASPDPVAGFTLQLHMMDPMRTPIEDAVVAAEFRLMAEHEVADSSPPSQVESRNVAELELPGGDWRIFSLQETGPGGNYAGSIVLPEAGAYQLIMRDTTFPQEDAVAELIVQFDGTTVFEPSLFIFPPTDVGAAKLSMWLIWLIVIPAAAGVAVTVLVLVRKAPTATEGAPG